MSNIVTGALQAPLMIRIHCPYCGQKFYTKVDADQKMVRTCPRQGDQQGCGRDFVLTIEQEITYKVLRIEE